MKKTVKPRTSANRPRKDRVGSSTKPDDLRPHYDFDYARSRPSRFASRLTDGTVAIVLDPDVAAVFRSDEAVNTFLRSAIAAMPAETGKKRRAS
jgi:hypothetical protein